MAKWYQFWNRNKKNFSRKGFDGAGSNRLLNDFVSGTRSIDDILKNDIRRLRDRCRDLSRNNEFVRRYINLMKTNVIGSHGIKLQVRSKDANQNLDYVANNIIESRWRRWILKDNCDLSKRLGWLDMQNLLVQTLFTDGEVLIQFVENADNDFKFAINFLDCDLIDENRNGHNGNNEIRMGVEFDSRTKRPIAYYLFDKNPYEYFMHSGTKRSSRVSAENLLHIYIPERANQSRGYSPISSVLKELKMLHAYAEAELVASRVNASAMGFITSPSGDAYTGEDTSSDGFSPMMNVEAGTIQQLPSGADFKKFDTTHPTTAFDPFIKSILRQISAGLNVSYNDLSNDYSSVNYSSIRQASLNDRDYYKTIQQFVINHFCKPVYERWLKMYLTIGDEQLSPLPMSKYNKFNDTVFIPRAFDWIDPLKEMNANVVGLKAGVVSLQDVVSKTGRDVEEHFEQLEKEKKLAEDFNINFAYEPYGDKGATGGNNNDVSMQENQTNNNESNKENVEDN